MTKTKSTKSALISSVLALLLCFTMLIGTTFAWFTDSVTSAGNKIMSGTLQVDLELLDKDSGEWNSIKEDKTALFNNDKWEPGYTEVKMLKVENEGTLALKWKAKFVAEKELSILADVIDVYVLPYGVLDDASGVKYPADRNLDGYTKVGTLREFVNTIETTTYGNLEAGESAYLGIALKMQESANNDYQGLDLGGAFDILILATQLDSEEDAFGKDYDAGATYEITVDDAAGLIANLTNITEETIIDATGVSLNVDNIGTTTEEILVPTFSIPTGTTIKGAEFKIESTSMISAEKTAVSDTVVFDQCDIVTADVDATDGTPAMALVGEMDTSVSSTTYVFNNCTFEGYIMLNGINAEFNNCTFVLSKENDGATKCSVGEYTFNDCTFNYENGTNLIAPNNIYADSYATVVLKNCTLVSATYGSSTDSTITVE